MTHSSQDALQSHRGSTVAGHETEEKGNCTSTYVGFPWEETGKHSEQAQDWLVGTTSADSGPEGLSSTQPPSRLGQVFPGQSVRAQYSN